jgi:protease I
MDAKRVLVLVAEGFHDEEAAAPVTGLREKGVEVTIAAPKTGEITGKHGRQTLEATVTPGDCKPEDYDALVLPGGSAPEVLRLEDDVLALVRDFFALPNRPVAAICHGPQVLISAGVLAGRQATGYAGIRDDMRLAGARVVDRKVVVDERLITSRTPDDLDAWVEAIATALFPPPEDPEDKPKRKKRKKKGEEAEAVAETDEAAETTGDADETPEAPVEATDPDDSAEATAEEAADEPERKPEPAGEAS